MGNCNSADYDPIWCPGGGIGGDDPEINRRSVSYVSRSLERGSYSEGPNVNLAVANPFQDHAFLEISILVMILLSLIALAVLMRRLSQRQRQQAAILQRKEMGDVG